MATAVALEETYPGFADGIRRLRDSGFTDVEIQRAIASRMDFLKKAGGSPEAVAALARGKPSPYDIHMTFDKAGNPNAMAYARALSQLDEWRNRNKQESVPWGPGEEWLSGKIEGIKQRLNDAGMGTDVVAQRDDVAQQAQAQARLEAIFGTIPGAPISRFIGNVVRDPRGAAEAAYETPIPGIGSVKDIVGAVSSVPSPFREGGPRLMGESPTDIEAARAATMEQTRTESPGYGLSPEQQGAASTLANIAALGTAGTAARLGPMGGPAQPGTAGRGTWLGDPHTRPIGPPEALGPPEATPAQAAAQARMEAIRAFHDVDVSGPTVTERIEPGSIPGETFRRGAPTRRVAPLEPSVGSYLDVAEIQQFAGDDAASELATLRAAEKASEDPAMREAVRAHAEITPPEEGAPQPAPPEAVPPQETRRRGGRPTTRSVEVRTGTQDISDDAARTALAGWKSQQLGLSPAEALDEVRGMQMEEVRKQVGVIQRHIRLTTGELSGKRGRPAVPGMPEAEPTTTGSAIVDEMMPRVSQTVADREVRIPSREVVQDPGLTLQQQRLVAKSKGFDLQYDTTIKDAPIQLVSNGGSAMGFKTLDALRGYLETQDSVPMQPVELPDPVTGDSAFERIVKGEEPTGEQKMHMSRQKRRMDTARSRPGGFIADDAQEPATEITEPAGVKRIALRDDQKIGSVEDLPDQRAAQVEMAKVEAAGLKGRILNTKSGKEVVFYRDLTPEISRLIGIHRRVLERGPLKGADAAEHREVARAFGIPEEEISDYLRIHGLMSQKGPLGRLYEHLISDTLSEGLPDMAGRSRYAAFWAGTQNSGDPAIRLFGKDITQAIFAHGEEMKQWKTRLDHLQTLVPDTKRAQDIAEGVVKPVGDAEHEFLTTWQRYREDFAKRATQQGLLKENAYIANYATHKTDLDAVFKVLRDEIVGAETYKDLDLRTQSVIKADQYEKWRDAFLKHPTRDTMPRNTWDAILGTMKQWKNYASTANDLPAYIRNNLPAHISVKYFEPRTGGSIFKKDFYSNTADYMNDAVHALHFNDLVKKWDPLIRQQAQGGFGTSRDFMEKIMSSVVMRRPSSDKLAVDFMTRHINDIIGKEFLKVDTLPNLAQLIRDAFLRGTIGFAADSAFRHSTHIISGYLANGRVTGPMSKAIVANGGANQVSILQEFMPLHQLTIRDLKPSAVTLREAARVSSELTKWSMSPIQLSESLSKSVAFAGAMEDAAKRGLSNVETMKLGFAAASEVVPDTRVTEAYWSAMNSMLSSQTTMLPHMRSPYMLSGPIGKLSNIFLVWPSHAAQFVNNQVRTAVAESLMRNDSYRLLRWSLFFGGLVGLHQSGHVTGVNWDDFFIGHAANLVTALPFYRVPMNAVRAALGEPSVSTEQAKRDLITSLKQMTPGYPSWRYGGKMQEIVTNIQRGYDTDAMGRHLYEIGPRNGPFYTSVWGELMRSIGLQPQAAVNARAIAHTIAVESFKRGQAKRDAIHQFLQSQDPTAILQFGQKYGGAGITTQDLQKEIMRTQELYQTRMLQRVPAAMRPQLMQQMGEME